MSATEVEGPTPTYRVAIAGAHRMLQRELAGHNWAAAFAGVERCRLVAVFDRGADTRRQFVECWGSMPAFAEYEDMLAETRPDIVCVTTRQTMHADQIEAAARAGVRGILCEKPLATSMAEVDRIASVCRSNQLAFAFGLDRRWSRRYERMVRAVRDGLVGEVQAITAFGIPTLVNLGCHWFDVILRLAGDPEVAWVSGSVDPLSGEPPDSRRHLDPPGSCRIGFANGVEAFASWRGTGLEFDVVGTGGRAVLTRDGAELHYWRNDDPVVRRRRLAIPAEAPAWPRAVRDLVDALDGGGVTLCDVECARRASEISFAVHDSHRRGGRPVSPSEIDRDLRVESFPWGNE
jgi:predicted dehydrogenase